MLIECHVSKSPLSRGAQCQVLIDGSNCREQEGFRYSAILTQS